MDRSIEDLGRQLLSRLFIARNAHPCRVERCVYRGTSLIQNRHPVGPYSKTMPRLGPRRGCRFQVQPLFIARNARPCRFPAKRQLLERIS